MTRMHDYVAASLTLLALAACSDVTPSGPGRDLANAAGTPAMNSENAANDRRTECRGTLAGEFESVVVPAGENCFLVGATVSKDVTALEDAILSVFDTRIGGDLIGRGADVVQTARIVVGGNVRIQNGGPHPVFLEVAICGADITGNVTVAGMTGSIRMDPHFCGSPTPNIVRDGNVRISENVIPSDDLLSVTRNVVTGKATVSQNTGSGTKTVQLNTVSRLLMCEENDEPFVGGPNTAGTTRGQCF